MLGGILSPSPDVAPQCGIPVVALYRVRIADSLLIQLGEGLGQFFEGAADYMHVVGMSKIGHQSGLGRLVF